MTMLVWGVILRYRRRRRARQSVKFVRSFVRRSSRRTGIFVFFCQTKPVSNTVHTANATHEDEHNHPPKSTLPTSFPFSANPSSQLNQRSERTERQKGKVEHFLSGGNGVQGQGQLDEPESETSRSHTTFHHVIVIVVVWDTATRGAEAPGSSLIGLYVENPKFRPQIRYVLAPKSAISDRDVTFFTL